jgi:hypothetical protein
VVVESAASGPLNHGMAVPPRQLIARELARRWTVALEQSRDRVARELRATDATRMSQLGGKRKIGRRALRDPVDKMLLDRSPQILANGRTTIESAAGRIFPSWQGAPSQTAPSLVSRLS